jgi:hypothetical protein
VACNREVIDVNPNYDPLTNEVTTQFVVSVSTGQSGQTRMTPTAVQNNSGFRGIEDAKLFTFLTGIANNNGTTYPYVDGTHDANRYYDLGTLFASNTIDASKNQTESSNRILQLSVPLNTDAVLFYGRAIRGAEYTKKALGAIDYDISSTPSKTWFHTVRRIGTEDDVRAYDATARLMIYVINYIIKTSVSSAETYGGYTNLDAISWKSVGASYATAPLSVDPLGQILGSAYQSFTNIKAGEYRAGCSTAVMGMIKDMYTVINSVATASTPTSKEEANSKRLAAAIKSNIDQFFQQNSETGAWSYKEISVIKALLTNNNIMSEDQWYANFGKTVGGTSTTIAKDLNKYPYEDFNIPDGAAQLAYDTETGEFSYKHPNDPLVNPHANDFEPRKYAYPLELMYYVNSGLRTTSLDNVTSQNFPNGVNPWDDDENERWVNGLWKKNTKVASSTRGIAVRDNINYGVALFETKVAYGSNTIKDNREAMTGGQEQDQVFSPTDLNITLTGVLVGGINPKFDWEFLPIDMSGQPVSDETELTYGKFDGVIYDDQIVDSGIPTINANYTIVPDNYDASKADDALQNNVYVALEFQNNGDDFWGEKNLVAKGNKFYLVARLDCTYKDQTTSEILPRTVTWPTYYQIPPLDDTGKSKKIPRVFIQDYVTSAVFKIGLNSLKFAYVTVPDLRSSQMSLGLSVDIQWRQGFTYEDLEFGSRDDI